MLVFIFSILQILVTFSFINNSFQTFLTMTFFKSYFLPFLFILTIFQTQAQEKKEVQTETSIEKNEVISIDDISIETEKLGLRILDLKKILKQSTKVQEVDSLVTIVSIDINSQKEIVFEKLKTIDIQELETTKLLWKNYYSTLKKYQETLKNRTENVSEVNDEMVEEIAKWEKTKEEILSKSSSADVEKRLNEVISKLQDVMDIALDRLDNIFLIQSKLTELVLVVDEVSNEIKNIENEIKKDYFTIDAAPLWEFLSEDKDSDVVNTTESSSIKEVLKVNIKQLKEFILFKKNALTAQIIFIIFLLIFLSTVKKKWNTNSHSLTSTIEKEANIIVNHPFSAALVIGVLVSAFFYSGLVPVFREIHIFLVIVGTIYLLPKLTEDKFRVSLLFLFMSFLLHVLPVYFISNELVIRLLIIMEAFALIFALNQGRAIIKLKPESFDRIHKIYLLLSPFFGVTLMLAIVANIIGMTGLSNFIVEGIFFSSTFGMIVYLIVKIITGLLVLLFKRKNSSNIQTFSTMVKATHQRFQPILYWIAFVFWVYFTLSGFRIYSSILNYINEVMHIQWNVGEMTISLGGTLAFTSIFIITLLLAKLAASIFQDEWVINTLPRGIAPAISLLLRIFLIAIGFYIGMSAAGIDLSKIGFIAGTLGVGIGFGLQNVVLNFVAGLILAFERPVNLGDVVEIDQEKGVITNIGVRSSNIRTYTGAEAIIPNGDLISKKVINWTLTNRDRRSKILMKTAANANPEKVIELFNTIATEHEKTFKDPAPKTYFYGYDLNGNLDFSLMYWTTFSDTLSTDNQISLRIFKKLQEEGITAPIPARRIISND